MPRYVTRGRKTRQLRRRTKRAPVKKYRRPTRPTRSRRYGGMTKRSILNLTSRKKKDTMLQWAQTNGVDGAGTAKINYQAGNGGPITVFAWCPTARDLSTDTSGDLAVVADDAARTATRVYQVGLKERIRLQASYLTSYTWRRVCFTSKGLLDAITKLTPISLETSNGWVRYTKDISSGGTGQAAALDLLRSVIFKGNIGQDWNNYITAPLDNSRVTIMYDKVTTIRSRGDNEVNFTTTRWHPMNKTFVYDDDELGGSKTAAPRHALGRAGMGDYIVLDFFEPGPNAHQQESAYAAIDIESTMYWHER